MILLASTSDKVQVVSGTTGSLSAHASYVDYDSTTPTVVTPGRKNTNWTTAATTDVVLSPGSSTIVRNVKALFVRNDHASIATTVLVQHTDGTTVAKLTPTLVLLAGESLDLNAEGHYTVFDQNGQAKSVSGEGYSKRIAGPISPAKSEAGTTLYTPGAGKRAKIDTAVVTNTHASLWAWATLSIGSIATKANRVLSGLPMPPGTTVIVPVDITVDGDASDDIRARQTVDMTYSSMTVASAVALIADTNAGSATSLATAAWAAKVSAVYVMFVSWTGTPTISSFTDTHTGVTWTLIDSIDNTAGDTHLAVYRSQSSGTTSTTTTVVFSAAPTGAFISIQELVGADASGANGDAAVMKAGTRYLSPTNTNLYIAGTELAGGRLAAFMHNGAAGTWTPGSGFTEVHDGTYATPSTAFTSLYALTPGKDASAVASTTSVENLMALVDIQDSTKVLSITLNGVEIP